MFLLKNAIKGETYVYFAVQKREGKKTRPVRVKSFGKLSELLAKDPDALAHLQEELDRINASPEKSESVVYSSLKERGTDTDCCGNIVLLSEIKRLGLPGIFGGIRTESGFDTARIASDLVCERILDPRSKLASYRKISGNPFYQAGYGINDVYRSLDKIDSFSGGNHAFLRGPLAERAEDLGGQLRHDELLFRDRAGGRAAAVRHLEGAPAELHRAEGPLRRPGRIPRPEEREPGEHRGMQDRGALPEGALEGGHLELHILRGCRHSVDGHQDTQLGLRTPLRRRAAREDAGLPAEAMGPVGYGMAPREQESGFGRGLSGGRLPLEGGALCRGRQEGREEGTHPGAARRDLLGGVGKMAGGNPRGAAAESGEEGGEGDRGEPELPGPPRQRQEVHGRRGGGGERGAFRRQGQGGGRAEIPRLLRDSDEHPRIGRGFREGRHRDQRGQMGGGAVLPREEDDLRHAPDLPRVGRTDPFPSLPVQALGLCPEEQEGGAGGDGYKGIVRRHRRGAQDDVRDEAEARVCPRLRGQRRSEGDTQGPSEGERTGKARCPVPPRRQEEEDPEGTKSIGN